MERQREEPSLGELFSRLASDTSTLVRKEVDLARTEMVQKATAAGRDVGMLGAGGAIAYAGFLALLAAVIIGLGYLIPVWLSALIVGLLVVGVGALLIQRGLSALKRLNPVPEQTIETLKEDVQWAKEQTK
ncbi:MAG TPA: phage holin family protein [Chloroflexaceae bacterium]|nr:phage holin family protein [Chloroflexaceae bacterium]